MESIASVETQMSMLSVKASDEKQVNINAVLGTVPPTIIRTVLNFDGSHLGEYEFSSIVKWWYPCNKTTSGLKPVSLYAMIKFPEIPEIQYVILKRNCAGNVDQLVVDELKPLFGLQKMGTHSIRIKGIPRKYYDGYPWIIDGVNGTQLNTYIHQQWSDYLILKAPIQSNKEGKITFIPLPSLNETAWCPSTSSEIKEGHKKFYFEIQKILIFRGMLRISNTNLNNILVKNIGSTRHPRFVPMSIDEMKVKAPNEPYRKLTQELEKFFFAKTTSRTEITIRMLGFDKDHYRDQIEILRNSMTRIITRVDQDKLWLVDDIIAQITDHCSIYYDMINSH